ncbi:histone H1-like [Haemorhous mexicanus]|uniref:histone H1-like n=1 Tax=Haemorhous mexicanus TaxID=30427 RepID=UPI0028BD5E66|nr:histone H1-like [Haemorhous mexicanus]
MLDTAAAAPRTRAATRKPKKAASGSKARQPAGPSVTQLITRAVSVPKERKGLSLATLRKALASGGYDVEKNQSRIKLGPKSLVSNGTLVQTKGIGASGSFKLNKKPGETKEKATKEKRAAKPRKPVAKTPASPAEKPKKAVVVKKSPKKAKKLAATAAKKAAKSPKRATQEEEAVKSPAKTKAVKPTAAKKAAKSPKRAIQAGHPKEAAKSPAKEKAVKPAAAKPKAAKPKAANAKKAVPKKK